MPRKAMVPADQEDRVSKVEEGETFKFTVREGDPPERWSTGPNCGLKAGRWICSTHDAAFQNQIQKDIHIQTGKHRLAWVCPEHGPEVP